MEFQGKNILLAGLKGDDALTVEVINATADPTIGGTFSVESDKFNRMPSLDDQLLFAYKNTANGKAFLCVGKITGKTLQNATITITSFADTTGAKGEQGEQGIQGEKGEKGDTGAQGIQGEKGDKGDTGAQGAQGIQGEQGEQGEKGDKGDKGDDGTTFTPSVDSAGNLSWTNDGGKPNPETVNIKGAKGDTGATGAKGDKGDTGDAGESYLFTSEIKTNGSFYVGDRVGLLKTRFNRTPQINDELIFLVQSNDGGTIWFCNGKITGESGVNSVIAECLSMVTINTGASGDYATSAELAEETETRTLADQAIMALIDDIEDGTTTVAKANKDGEGNVISETYAKKSEVTGGGSTRIFYTDTDLRALNLGATQAVGINYNASPDDPPKAGDYVKDPYGVFVVLKEDYDIATDMAQVACVATVSEDEGSTNVFKITYSLQTTVGANTGIDDAMISPSANLIKKGDIAVDPNNTVGLFQTDYDESGIQIVKTICSATGASGKTYTHNITIDCGNNGFVTAQVLSTDDAAFATVADFISFLSENGLKVNTKTPLNASGFYIQTAGSAEVTYPIVGIGQYGNRTDGVGIYYFRTDVSAGRSGYQIIMTTNIETFTDTVTEG